MRMRTWILFSFIAGMLLTVQVAKSKTQERVDEGEDLNLTLDDDNFNEIEYLIYLPKGDGAEFRLIFTNKEISETAIEYTLIGSNLELLDTDLTVLKNDTRNPEFYGKLLPGQSSTDLYRTPGLCCDCYKLAFMNFNKTESGVVFFKMDYKVTDEGDTCGILGVDLTIIPVVVSLITVLVMKRRKLKIT
jgi:hypothetical protein